MILRGRHENNESEVRDREEHSLKNAGKTPVTMVGVFPTAIAAEIDPT